MENKFKNRIKELRKSTGLSQSEFAQMCNVRQSAVSKWERGETYPSLDVLTSIAITFDVSSDYLLGISEF